MKRFAIVGKNKENVKALKQHILHHDFVYDEKKPEFVISLGGDGTYLYAERDYPSIPKLMIRDSNICNKCEEDIVDVIIKKIKKQQYTIEECIKLDAHINGKYALTCANDFILRNKRLTQAIRFAVDIDEKRINNEFIGDGVIIATPYGSTAYYYSITKQHFRYGIGLAFNNLTKHQRPLVVDENAVLRISMIREEAELAADNQLTTITLKEGDSIEIKKARQKAKIMRVNPGIKEKLKQLPFIGRRRSM